MPGTYVTKTNLAPLGMSRALFATIEPEDIDSACTAANAYVDSYIGRVFNLPLRSFGVELSAAAAKIAAYELLSVRGFNPDTPQGELLQKRYDTTRSWLKDIAEGRAKPSWPDTVTATGTNPTMATVVLAPSQGGIGISGGSASLLPSSPGDQDGTPSCVGTPGPPRLRGW